MQLASISPTLGVEVSGLDLAQPLDSATVNTLREQLHRFGLLLVRDQNLGETDSARFSKYFGRISRNGAIQKTLKNDVSYVSNARPDGTNGNDELLLHNDGTFYPIPPKAISLYGVQIPASGAETLFVNTAAALKVMPQPLLERLRKCRAKGSIDYGKVDYGAAKAAEIQQKAQEGMTKAEHIRPLLVPHPWSDQTVMLLSEGYGCILDEQGKESKELLHEVNDYLLREDQIYRHAWRPGDLVIWDNYLLMHARAKLDSTAPRTLRRCLIAHEDEVQ